MYFIRPTVSTRFDYRNSLMISSLPFQDKFETDSYVYQERTYGKKSRSISLPGDADENHITTSFVNGVLDLSIPKAASKASFKTIEVK
jgi:HSP20 family molecular chaperone IbpA